MARKLSRDTRGAVIGGVAAGFGRYLDVDPVVVRLAFVLGTLLGGAGLLFYVICWVIVPREESAGAAPAGPPAGEEQVTGSGEPPLDRMAGELRQAGDSFRRHLGDAAPGVSGPRLVVGCFLVLFGAVLLLDELHWFHWPRWVRPATLWPVVLVAMGVALLVRSNRERPQ